MFGFRKTLDVITLFKKAGSPASARVSGILKQASALAAAEGQGQREQFNVQETEDWPTADQLQTMIEYAGVPGIPSIVKDAHTQAEALRKYRENKDSFRRPLIVDWIKGKVIASEDESEILKALGITKKQ